MKKPNFFIIGAPKCGTTTLAHWLSQHPQVYFSSQKETRHFSKDLAVRQRVRDYRALFAGAESQHAAIGEGSTEYIYSEAAVPDILEFQPQAKFIVMLRNPADLVWSWHRQLLFDDVQVVEDFDKAWRLGFSLEGLKNSPRKYETKLLSYQFVGALGSHLSRVFEAAGRERCHVILLDDMKEDGNRVFGDVLCFLGLDNIAPMDRRPVNVGIERRSTLLSRVVRMGQEIKYRTGFNGGLGILNYINNKNRRVRTENLDDRQRSYLTTHFLSEIEIVETLLARELSSWKDAVSTRNCD